MNFTLRVYRDSYPIIWYNFSHITISNITLISKHTKFDPVCEHNGNKKRFGYSINVKGKFAKVSGSNSYPILHFKGEYIDIEVKNFPRFPVVSQDKYHARNLMAGYADDSIDNGFDQLHFDILNLC